MTRKIKVLGMAVVAVLAMSAFASAAQAAPTVEVGGGEGTITSVEHEGKHKFVVDGSAIECKQVMFKSTGNVKTGDTWVRIHPTYEECTAFGFIGATVTTTGCDYELMSTEEKEGHFVGETKVVCEAGKEIIIVGGTCEAKVGPQSIGGITGTNVTTGKLMTVTTHINSEVETNKTKDGFACPFSGTGKTKGTYTGTTTDEAFKDANHLEPVDLTVKK